MLNTCLFGNFKVSAKREFSASIRKEGIKKMQSKAVRNAQ